MNVMPSSARGSSRALVIALLLLLGGPALGASAYTVSHRGVGFDVYRLDKGEEQRLRFFWRREDGTPYGSIHALREALSAQGKELVFAINGAIYSKQLTPLGLYIENGKRYYRLNMGAGSGNFLLKPNGVFYITDQGAVVVDTEEYDPRSAVKNAIQSGPLLVKNGRLHPRFIAGHDSKYIRDGVGMDRNGRVVFAISNAAVNFYDFATLFRDALDCPNALYLDGNISEMHAPQLNRYGGWPWHQFTTIIAIVSDPSRGLARRAAPGNTQQDRH